MCLGIEAHATSHLSESSFLGTELKQNEPKDAKANEEKKAAETKTVPATEENKKEETKAVPATEEKKKEETKAAPATEEKKPEKKKGNVLESAINIMRGELCWKRHELMEHHGCMKWLVKECTTHTFGTGLCKKVRKHVKEECLEKNEKACEYAKILGIDMSVDTDGDGVQDKDDAFPKDPKETKDTDGDGVGDNADEAPNDATCVKKPCEPPAAAPAPEEAKQAPAPAPEKAPEKAAAPAPAKEEPKAAPAPAKEEPKAAPAPAKEEAAAAPAAPTGYQDPVAKDGLASQGFSGKKVKHGDGETVTGDWGKEYGGHKSEPTKSGGLPSRNMHAFMSLAAMALAFVWAA